RPGLRGDHDDAEEPVQAAERLERPEHVEQLEAGEEHHAERPFRHRCLPGQRVCCNARILPAMLRVSKTIGSTIVCPKAATWRTARRRMAVTTLRARLSRARARAGRAPPARATSRSVLRSCAASLRAVLAAGPDGAVPAGGRSGRRRSSSAHET